MMTDRQDEIAMDHIPTLYPQLSEREHEIVSTLMQAAQAVSSALHETEGSPSRTKRRGRDAVLNTARATLIHARHDLEASGLKNKLSASQREALTERSAVQCTPGNAH
jgi:hypothetical protein